MKKGYHTHDNKSEEIDGVLEVYGWIVLLEVKWVNKDLAATSLFSFIGKIENKFEGAIGLFVSRDKLSDNFIRATRKGRRQTVIVIDGECVDTLINRKLSFKEYITEAIKYLSYENSSVYPIVRFVEKIKYKNATNPEKEILKDAKLFVNNYIYNKTSNENDLIEICNVFSNFSDDLRQKVFEIIIDEYQENLWERGPFESGGDFCYEYIYSNRAKFLFAKFAPSNSYLSDLTLRFVSELLFFHLEKFSNSFIVNLIAPFYSEVDREIRLRFERELLRQIDDNLNYYFENSVTCLIETLWGSFSIDTIAKLKEYYLGIFFSARSEKFKQKSFSIKLVENSTTDLKDVLVYIKNLFLKRRELGNVDSLNLKEFSFLEGKLNISNKELKKRISQIYSEVNAN